jgi:hypothetical protein
MERFARGLWPPREAAFREALEAQPEALTIVDQELECGASAVAKQEYSSGERVTVETVAAERGERVDAFAEIDRLISEHDGKLWGKLDHGLGAKKAQAEGFELGRVSGTQMKRQTRAVGTLEEQAGVRICSRCVAWHKL